MIHITSRKSDYNRLWYRRSGSIMTFVILLANCCCLYPKGLKCCLWSRWLCRIELCQIDKCFTESGSEIRNRACVYKLLIHTAGRDYYIHTLRSSDCWGWPSGSLFTTVFFASVHFDVLHPKQNFAKVCYIIHTCVCC